MIKHTFLDKCCTIIKDSELNTGLNPVAELNYGNDVSRALIHFDIEGLKEMVDNKTFANIDSLRHVLKLTNCGSVNNDVHNMKLTSGSCSTKDRATSFDVILFKVPMEWDNGKGVDFITDFWISDNHKFSNSGCNWFQRMNGAPWENEGIYTTTQLSQEYEKYSAGEDSIIISRQHFDIGNENFEFDITDYVNDLIERREINNGLGLAFSPLTELAFTEKTQYIGFFGPYTNTFFHPYLESVYYEQICDDRDEFHMGRKNRLYFYCIDFNLDEMPTCHIDGLDIELEVKQQTKGVYYTEFTIEKGIVEKDTILYDVWDNLIVDGKKMEAMEYAFVVLEPEQLFGVKKETGTYVPHVSGMNDDERVQIGELRELVVSFRKKYTTNQQKFVKNAEYRLYCMDGSKELVVFDYQPIDRNGYGNTFMIDTTDLIPNKYHIDIRRGNDYFRDVLRFEVVSNINNKYI